MWIRMYEYMNVCIYVDFIIRYRHWYLSLCASKTMIVRKKIIDYQRFPTVTHRLPNITQLLFFENPKWLLRLL